MDDAHGTPVALATGFVKEDGGSGGRVERFDAAGHGNADARVGGALHFDRKAGAFVANQERGGQAPIYFPRL